MNGTRKTIKTVTIKSSYFLKMTGYIDCFFGFLIMKKLEIKPCGLGSRIRDMEAEWRLKVITDLISY